MHKWGVTSEDTQEAAITVLKGYVGFPALNMDRMAHIVGFRVSHGDLVRGLEADLLADARGRLDARGRGRLAEEEQELHRALGAYAQGHWLRHRPGEEPRAAEQGARPRGGKKPRFSITGEGVAYDETYLRQLFETFRYYKLYEARSLAMKQALA